MKLIECIKWPLLVDLISLAALPKFVLSFASECVDSIVSGSIGFWVAILETKLYLGLIHGERILGYNIHHSIPALVKFKTSPLCVNPKSDMYHTKPQWNIPPLPSFQLAEGLGWIQPEK